MLVKVVTHIFFSKENVNLSSQFLPSQDVEENLPSLLKQPTRRLENPSEKLYTLDEVKGIVAKALQQKEEELRQEYDEILLFRLQGWLTNLSFLSFSFLFFLPFRAISKLHSIQ
jgi:hypothetical protein